MNIVVLPSFSLEPNKMSTFNRVFVPKKSALDPIAFKVSSKIVNKSTQLDAFQSTAAYEFPKNIQNTQFVQNAPEIKVKRSFHNFTISDNAYRTLKRKINWLYYFSKAKHIKTYNGKDIFNFKIAFLTLTLPSTQTAPTKVITNELFNHFLTEIRQRTKMVNYVWRLEFQKNGNVHYHIVTDTYIDYFLALKVWNRILTKHNYTQAYTHKHKSLSLSQYNQMYNSNSKIDFSVIAKRYAKGCSVKWSQPNTVDVKSVISNKKIANYISKYFGKNSQDNAICNILDNEENSKSMRLWFCSRSLSKLNSVTNFIEAVEYDIFNLISNIKDVKQHLGKWARTFYFDFKNCVAFEHKWLTKIFYDYGKKQGYFSKLQPS